ncbi:MAG TPA: tRNA-uridine aminocarboxypropyltransferase [Candidatus Krumholzibacteria bacterium]|nr:tRNA-uridine aminocarboxypropyltransferase [Candidatus Krumholzibacteria bacterium]
MKLADYTLAYPGRCPTCLMKQHICLCGSVRPFPNRTPVTIVMHRREVYKPSGTSRLTNLALGNCDVYLRGHVRNPLDLEQMFPEPESCLYLNLSERSQELDRDFAESHAFTRLVVPDGSWRQARKMGRREPTLERMQWVRLPSGIDSRYRLRRQPVANGLATIEAIAIALGILDGPAVEDHLNAIFALMVERTLADRLAGPPSII